MIDAIIRSQEEENLLSYDVSDEAIEACTGLSVCPG
jgi:hypothetical protein